MRIRLKKPANWTSLLVTPCLTLLATFLMLEGWQKDFLVPFNYWGDTIYELALVKSIAEGGWIYHIDRLGAPFGLDVAAFPQNLTTTSLMIKGIALFSTEPGLILNSFWILSIVLTSFFCHLALRALNIPNITGTVVSVLYALLPYAFFRNTAHISLTYIFVPIIAAFSIEVLAKSYQSDEEEMKRVKVSRPLLLLAAVAVGFDYIYTAFFSCFFLAMVASIDLIRRNKLQSLSKVAPVLLVVVGCAAINFIPSIISWSENGIPPNMDYKSAAEAETYGLKIRHLITPPSLPPSNVSFPLENENRSAKLGVIGAVGFVLALYAGIFGERNSANILSWSAGALTISGTLLATIGGFGSIFNLVVTPDIRAYNRIVVFLAFFSFLALSVGMEKFKTVNVSHLHLTQSNQRGKLYLLTILFGILIIGLADQGRAATPLIDGYSVYDAQADEDRDIAKRIEQLHPETQQIYQLPETSFPPDGGRHKMVAYDHGRPYIWTTKIKWSWPNFSHEKNDWVKTLGTPNEIEFYQKLTDFGFDGVWLDRFGYADEELALVERQLKNQLGQPVLTSKRGRFLFYKMDKVYSPIGSRIGSP